MKHFILAFLLIGASLFQVRAQEHQKQFGIGGQVFYSDVFWTSSKENKVDSFNQLDHGILGVNPQLWYFVEWKRYNSLQVGLQYSITGHQRRAENIEFGKYYHPDMPRVTDNIQGDPRHIDFVYRSHYIGVPILWNREIIALRKSISLHYFFTSGISMGFLVYDKTVAHTRGFGFDGKNRFVVNNIYESNPFNAQLHIGGRIEYMIDARYRAHMQPMLNLPLTSMYGNGNKAYAPSVGISFMVSLIPGKEAATD